MGSGAAHTITRVQIALCPEWASEWRVYTEIRHSPACIRLLGALAFSTEWAKGEEPPPEALPRGAMWSHRL